jgi:hypothetical protein
MADYHRMWQGIQASGRPMILTVEGSPPADIITHGGYGNAKRVGHDISPSWGSMISLVDIGSGLWPYAHNSKDPQYGGWWNDLDVRVAYQARITNQVRIAEFACTLIADAGNWQRWEAFYVSVQCNLVSMGNPA